MFQIFSIPGGVTTELLIESVTTDDPFPLTSRDGLALFSISFAAKGPRELA